MRPDRSDGKASTAKIKVATALLIGPVGAACSVHNSSVNHLPRPSGRPLAAESFFPLRALGVTLAAQVATTAALSTPAVLAPVAAPELGQSAADLGWFTGLAYFVAMFAGLFAGNQVGQRGAVRLTQLAMLLCAVGLILLGTRTSWIVLPAALCIGLAYGCMNPAAADILARHTPANRRGLYFSLKQTGVPLGVATAGLAVSALLPVFSWSLTATLIGLPCLAVAFLSELARKGLDRPQSAAGNPAAKPDEAGSPSVGRRAAGLWRRLKQQIRDPLALVFGDPRLRMLGLSSFAFASAQVCFLTFLVAYLHLDLRLPVESAALLLAASQLVSTLARVFWGYLSDRWMQPARLLSLLGLGTAIGMVALASLPVGAPLAVIAASAGVCAATAVAWNGVFFAEVSKRSPPGKIAQVNGGTQFVTFFGAMLGPLLFGLSVAASANYRLALACCGLLPLGAAAGLLLAERRI